MIETIILLGIIINIYLIFRSIGEWSHFTRGENPFRRTCKKCGAIQNQFHRAGNEEHTWWEEGYAGNNPDCKCHKYSDYHEY